MFGKFLTTLLILSLSLVVQTAGNIRDNLEGDQNPAFTCRRTCGEIQNECRDSCFSPPSSKSILKVRNEFNCIKSCLSTVENVIIKVKETKCQYSIVKEGDNSSRFAPDERCKSEAFRRSLVCKFLRDYPEAAKEVSSKHENAFHWCPDSEVVERPDGLYTTTSLSSSTADHDEPSENDGLLNREKRLAVETPRVYPRDHTDKSMSRNSAGELCATVSQRISPHSAIHLGSGQRVELLFSENYSQWFEIGSCSKDAKLRFGENDGDCKVKQVAHQANLVVDHTEENRKSFANCHEVPSVPFLICRDWILLDSRCSHVTNINE